MKESIRLKITKTVFFVAMVALLILGAATIVNITVMRDRIVQADRALGQAASEDSADALELETRAKMRTISTYLGQLADEKLGAIEHYAVILANTATAIFSNPDAYAPMEIGLPSAENAGVVTLYYTKPHAVTNAAVAATARLAANAGTYMKQILAVDDAVLTCYVSFKNGLHVICDADSERRTAADYDYNPAAREWFTGALQRDGVGFTDVTIDAQGRGLGIVCSCPFYNAEGQSIGVVGIGALIDEIDQLVLNVDLGETGTAFILNADGKMIIGDDIELTGDGKAFVRPDVCGSSPEIETLNLTDGGSGVASVNYADRDVYMAWYPIVSPGWTLVTTMDVSEALALAQATSEKISNMSANAVSNVNGSIVLSIVIVLAVLLVTGGCVWVVGRRRSHAITDPLKRLTESVGQISGGELDQTLCLKTGDEIEVLADSFNDMTKQLKEYIQNLTTVTAEKERIGAELHVATTIQASMLPCIFPAFPERTEFDIYATMTPAKEVGGDFYDFFLIDHDHLVIVIADVSGKGVPAALFMVIAKTLIKNSMQEGRSPEDTFMSVNAQLCENNEAGMFVTAWMGLLEISTGRFVYVNAGHNPPLLKRAGGDYEYLRSRAAFVLAGMAGVKYRSNETTLGPGDALFLYTDGVTEATNTHEELYGEERLHAILKAGKELPPMELLPMVKADLDAFVGEAPQFDDITMSCLSITDARKPDGSLTLPAKDESLDEVIAFVGAAMEAHGFDAKSKMQVELAVEELFVNVAHYAYQPGEGDATLSCEWNEKEAALEIALRDSGTPFDPLAKETPDVTLSAGERPIGGLGIFLTRKTMDAVRYDYENGQNVTRITKKRA